MDAFAGRGRRRKSEVVPLFNVAPAPPSAKANESANAAARRVSRVKPMSWSQRNVIPGSIEAQSQSLATHDEGPTATTSGVRSEPDPPTAKPNRQLNRFAQSIISINRQQQQQPQNDRNSEIRSDDLDSDGHAQPVNNQTDHQEAAAVHDPWGHVLGKVMRKTSFRVRSGDTTSGAASPTSKRVSFTQMLKSREVKDLVKQAIVTNHWSENASRSPGKSAAPAGRSSVMEHWMKTSGLRNANPLARVGDDSEDGEIITDDGIKSGFDVRDTSSGSMYGRTLLLEESCRRAFAQSGENRTQMDLQALKAWFQMTKLKITTDFERLQPAELDLLCRRMVLIPLHANEIVFRQGDEGDAMYIVFAGCVEVKVSQRILGEKVDVTVCELSRGDYFGERALLHDDPRAATIVATTPCELVRITRKDYNIMLKQDQQEFYSRMQLAGAVNSSSAHGGSSAKPSLLLPRSRSTLHQQTQLEYVNVLTKKKHTRSKADVDMLSEYLQTLKFFRGLPKTFVRDLCSVVDFLTLPVNAYVFKEGEVGDLFYIIFSGSVDVIVNSKDIRGNAQQTKLINLTEGSHFGELALMKGHGIRSATVLTREETKFLVICEKDYNATLRRMQKEDLAKRVGVLDRIPMFQTPEWTGDLLKEMSYVLSEQKLATGAVLFRQGEKAQQVYFVVRGELVITKEIADPVSKQKSVVFVERIGRDRVVGDDAAAGVNFNEVIYRELTATASTPVELLVLSKYDVFHRLSRAARETLRAAAHSHVESVVYLDRYHKTAKWDAYKNKRLDEHLNHERMRKLLPHVAKQLKTMKVKQTTHKRRTSAAPEQATGDEGQEKVEVGLPSSQTVLISVAERKRTGPTASSIVADAAAKAEREKTQREVQAIVSTQSQLVDANEFLLLDRVEAASMTCFTPAERTIAHHVSTFNADAPPRVQTRERQLKSALETERRRQVEVLNEGNPLSYFDLEAVQAHQRRQQAEVRGRAVSSRRLLLRKRDSSSVGSGAAAASLAPSPFNRADKSGYSVAEVTANNVMNQFFQENFIFSHPEKPVKSKKDQCKRLRLFKELEQRHSVRRDDGHSENDSTRRRRTGETTTIAAGSVASDKHASQVEATRKAAELLCIGDFVVVDVLDQQNDERGASGSPAFRIVRCCESIEAAKLEIKTVALLQRGRLQSEDEEDAERSTMFVISKKKFALMPRTTRPRVAEEAHQRAVVGRFLRVASVQVQPMGASGSASHTSDPMAIFASYQKLALSPTELRGAAAVSPKRDDSAVATSKRGKQPSPGLRLFAIASMVMSKQELETAFCDEPFLCIHALYPTEAEAMEIALLMPPQALKNALLCILPVGEWLHFEDAYDWCVQIESDRRAKQPPPPSAMTSSASPTRRKTGSIAGLPGGNIMASLAHASGPTRADWQLDKEKAHRLHQFICTRMGLHKGHEKDRRGGGELTSATGFTPRPTVTLKDKLTTLQDYLDTTSQSPLGTKNGANAHASLLGKVRQMKRFGSIMRSRIGNLGSISVPEGGGASPRANGGP